MLIQKGSPPLKDVPALPVAVPGLASSAAGSEASPAPGDPVRRRASASAWRVLLDRPRRSPGRRAFFLVHLWSGLIVGLLTTVAGVTGSAVVYRAALDRRLAPALYRVSGAPALPADELLAAVRRQVPGATPQSFDVEGSGPWVVRLTRKGGRGTSAYVDPGTGTVLGMRGDREGVMNTLEALHTELLGGSVGMYVNGVGAAGLLVLCLTGMVIWWPGRGAAGRALRIRTGNLRRFNWSLHTAGGFWISLPLAVQAFTGVFLSFGVGVALVLFGGRVAEFSELVRSPRLLQGCTPAPGALEHALQAAAALHPGAEDTFAELPADPRSSLTVFRRTAGDLRTGRMTVTAIDPCRSTVLRDVDSAQASRALRLVLWLDAFHFGLVGGGVTRALWVPFGLTPGALFLTGLLLWWRRAGRHALPFQRRTTRSRGLSRHPRGAA